MRFVPGSILSCLTVRSGLNLLIRRRGATTTEYALLLALIVVALIGTLSALGAVLNDKLGDIIQELSRVH